MSSGMKIGAGRVPAPKQQYRPVTFAMVETPRGIRRVPRDGCWRSRLNQIIDRHGVFKDDGCTPTSFKTRHCVRTNLIRLFEVLHKKFPFEDPQRFDYRHLLFLEAWIEERYENGVAGREPSLTPGTCAQYTSCLRKFCRWIGQTTLAEMVRQSFKSGDVVARSLAATSDKSWEGRGIDIAAKIDQAWEMEPWVGMALFAQAMFGLRKKESICLVPAAAWDGRFTLVVTEGAKGGRARNIPLWEDAQTEALGVLLTWLAEERRPTGAIGDASVPLKQNLRRYAYVLETIGVTKALTGTSGHGLRTGFACRLMASFGVTAPVRGGDPASLAREIARAGITATTESLGHSRTSIVTAYGGSNRLRPEVVFKDCEPPDLDAIVKRMAAHRKDRNTKLKLGSLDL